MKLPKTSPIKYLVSITPSQDPHLKKLSVLMPVYNEARTLRTLVRRVLDEAGLPRGGFVRAATEFIASQRHHMRME